jgi:hypothetical protein
MLATIAQSKPTQHRRKPHSSLSTLDPSADNGALAYGQKPEAQPVCQPIRRRSSKRSQPPGGPLERWSTDQVAEFLIGCLDLTSATVQADFRRWVVSRRLNGPDLLNISEQSLRRDGLNRFWIEGILEAAEECRKLVARTNASGVDANDDVPSVITIFEIDEP